MRGKQTFSRVSIRLMSHSGVPTQLSSMNDPECWNRYVSYQDYDAFRCLVERHSGMVYGAALRRTAQPDLAEEATQNVFVQLAKKAKSLRKPECLPAWLHRSVMLESAHLMRKCQRDREKLKRLAESTLHTQEYEGWREVVPFIDQALNQLSEKDRQLILSRYYLEKSYREIAHSANKTEAACRKQVSRVLDKLARLLRRQGVPAASSALMIHCLQPEFATASPLGLVDVIEGRVADLSEQSFASAAGASLVAVLSHHAVVVAVAALAALVPIASKRYDVFTKHDLVASRPPESILSNRLEAKSSESLPNVTMEAILAAHGTKQLELLLRWLPTADKDQLATLAEARFDQSKQSGRSSNSGSFWALLMRRWLGLDASGALAFAEAVQSEVPESESERSFLEMKALFRSWAHVAPEAALAAAKKRSSSLAVAVLNEIQKRDPLQVIELSRELDPGIAYTLNWGSLFTNLAERDLELATELAQSLPDAFNKDSALFAVAMATVETDPEAALALLGERAHHHVRVYEKWLESDPETAIPAIQALPKTADKLGLTRTAALSLAEQDVDAAEAWAKQISDPVARRAALVGVTVAAAKTDVHRAKSLLEVLDWDLSEPGSITVHTSGGSGSGRPPKETLENAAGKVIFEIGQSDRQAAFALLGRVFENNRYLDHDVVDRLYNAWISDDRQGYVRYLQDEAPPRLRQQMLRWYTKRFVQEDPRQALDWALAQDEAFAQAAAKRVFQYWRESDPNEAFDVLLETEFPNSHCLDACVDEALSFHQTNLEDVGRLQAWLAEQPDKSKLTNAHERIAWGLARTDLGQAASWIEQLEHPELRNESIASVVGHLVNENKNDPMDTLSWIEQLPDSSERQFWLRVHAAKWMENDPDTARKVLPETSLSERNLKRLLERS